VPLSRRSFVQRVGPLVVLLSGLPRVVPFLVVAGLLLVGLLAQGVLGAVLLLVLAGVLAALLTLAWPALQPGARVVRLAVLGLVVVRALAFLG
jgi:hypothetical protein